MRVIAIVERGTDGTYDIHLGVNNTLPFGLLGQGNTVQEAQEDFMVCIQDMKSTYATIGKEFPEFTIEYKYDTASFLQSYSKKFSLAGLEVITGINQRQLSQYLNGYRKPSPMTIRKIETSIHTFAQELSQTSFA